MNDQATTSEAIATVETPPLALPALMPAKTRALLMRATMEAESEVRALLGEYVAKHLKRDSDFGIIPGTPKPTLLKPGAEKLVDLFRCEPRYEVTHRIEQWDDSKPLFHYEFRCKVVERDTGNVLAEGFGSANSREGRYRWRNGERTCPDCKKATIIKGKAEYGGGFLCFAKKGGCGAKFPDDAPEIIDQQIGKVENDDVFTLVNTVLKMAKKRALVDGAIALARCSDLFTQDVEDFGDHHQVDDRAEPRSDSGRKREADAPRTSRQRQPARSNAASADTNKDWGMESAPSFGRKLEWEGREQWQGKPLASADIETLLRYEAAVAKVLDRDMDPRAADLLDAHHRDVQMAIAVKEPGAT